MMDDNEALNAIASNLSYLIEKTAPTPLTPAPLGLVAVYRYRKLDEKGRPRYSGHFTEPVLMLDSEGYPWIIRDDYACKAPYRMDGMGLDGPVLLHLKYEHKRVIPAESGWYVLIHWSDVDLRYPILAWEIREDEVPRAICLPNADNYEDTVLELGSIQHSTDVDGKEQTAIVEFFHPVHRPGPILDD